jgi:hypothetical protein
MKGLSQEEQSRVVKDTEFKGQAWWHMCVISPTYIYL